MTFTQQDVTHIADILADAARTEIMPRFKALAARDIRHKSSVFDPVTEADEAAERAITVRLRASFPGALIVGEEATAADPTLLDRLADAPLAFVVDPIDGTRNFVAGLPLFGVMAAAIVQGEIVAGVIHDPVCQDSAHALKGQGAWLTGTPSTGITPSNDNQPAKRLRRSARAAGADGGGCRDPLSTRTAAHHRPDKPPTSGICHVATLFSPRIPHGCRRLLPCAVL